MYKVIYRKNDGRVVGCYPFEYEPITVYVFKDIIPETGEEIEFEIPESKLANYDESKIEKMITQTCNAKFFYNKETCEAVEVAEEVKTGANQYLVYENGNLVVKNNLQNYEQLVEKYIRAKYSISQEFAILRQKETKPLEYSEYFEYCEECKAKAKREIEQ